MPIECNLKEAVIPDNIIKLKALTDALEFAGIVRPSIPGEIKELVMDEGTSYMVGLYKTEVIGIARNFASGGCEFPEHIHDEWELIVVYEGEMRLCVEGKNRVLGVRDFYYILPGQKHYAYFNENTWFLAITMPASDAWPEGG